MRIRSKLLIVLVLTTLVVCALLGVWGGHLLSRAVRESTILRLDRELAMVSAGLPAEADDTALSEYADVMGQRLGLRVTLIGEDGIVLADSGVSDVKRMDDHRNRPEVVAAFRDGRGDSVRHSDTTGIEYYYRALRVRTGRVGWARIALPSSDLDQVSAQYLLQLLGAILGAIALIVCLAWLVVGRLARPVERMTRYAERVAAGELDVEVPEPGEDELSRLAGSINRMKGSLVARVEELRAERSLLLAMTEGLDHGLLLVDPDQRVLLANDAFRGIFRLDFDPTDHRLAEVLRNPIVLGQVEACLGGELESRATVPGPAGTNRSFDLQVTSVELPGGRSGALILFFDTTRLEALEHVRQRFVADVSHELRTPVTSIKGAVETLLDAGSVDDGERRFLEIARRQADRMSELIADLTDLSRIETGAIDLERRVLDLSAMVRDVIEAVRSRHAQRTVTLDCRVSEGHLVFADSRRLEQVLINLVDNAVKYTPDGGTVTVTADRRGGHDVVTVEDTGCGIPAEDLEKVFNRFYRVDKARSRELGGTGLGLAIVKHLVKLHHGRIRVESAEGSGARFVLELPVSES